MPVTRIVFWRNGQGVDYGRLEAEHGKLDYRDSTDDEEVGLLPHRRDVDEPDPLFSDIRDGPNTSDTQRDEWLLKTEPLQGARLKWNIGERPPVVNDRTGVLDLEATGGVGGRNAEQHGTPAPRLPLERQILQEVEVTTPPRGGSSRARGPSGSRASSTTRRGTSSASDFYGRPIKGSRFGPME